MVGARVRDARKAAGLTQAALAAKVAVSRVSINNIEHGRQDSSLTLFAWIAWACGVTLGDLLPTSERP